MDMASGLRAKLNAMKGQTAAPAQVRTGGGLFYHVSRQPLDGRILELPPVGLRRIGWMGGAFDVTRCLFLDTETTGLSHGAGTVAFLVGVGFVEGGEFVIEQYMLRDYADEPELIQRLADRMRAYDSVCTFNGRNFDMPLLESRFTMCRRREEWRERPNIDLLYPARRAWKLRLGSCKLGRLEEQILGAPRENDLPGSEVPERFFAYLKSGDESLLEDIVRHNRQDIATLAALLILLCEINDRPEQLQDQRDLFSMGRSLERQGELGSARELYRISAIPRPMGTLAALTGERIAGLANWHIYLLCRKSGDWDGARQTLEQMLRRRQMQGRACTALSKLYEHRLGDLHRALEYARMSAQYSDAEEPDALKKRIDRIQAKLDAASKP